MKKAAILTLAVIAAAFLLNPVLLAESKDDMQAIKKAVKENPAYEPGKDAQWLKVLVVDNRTKEEKVKVTLPLNVVEIFLRCADEKHMKFKEGECEIDLAALFKELKALGPMALIEVSEDDETVKIWLE